MGIYCWKPVANEGGEKTGKRKECVWCCPSITGVFVMIPHACSDAQPAKQIVESSLLICHIQWSHLLVFFFFFLQCKQVTVTLMIHHPQTHRTAPPDRPHRLLQPGSCRLYTFGKDTNKQMRAWLSATLDINWR